MLYMAAKTDNGLRVFLGLGKENVDQIKADNPLVARLSNVGYPGLFFLYMSVDNLPSPRMTEINEMMKEKAEEEGFNVPSFSIGSTTEQLDALQAGQGCFFIDPESTMPGIDKIIIVFSDNHQDLVRKLKAEGVVANNATMTYIPRNILEN
jgi:hypothetical protein